MGAPFSVADSKRELDAGHHFARWQPEALRSSGDGRRGGGHHWRRSRARGAGRAGRTASSSIRRSSSSTTRRSRIVTDEDPDGLEVIRHSTAHLLAQAVKQLFPDAQVTIGPVIEDGFYYDFAFKRPFTPEDLAAIEARMRELARRGPEVNRTRDGARRGRRVLPRAWARTTRRRSSLRFRPTKRSASTDRATWSICAVARTCRPPASSRPSSS